MNEGMLIWMVIFAVFAVAFFGVAAVVAVTGWSDVRDLLTRPEPDSVPPDDQLLSPIHSDTE